MRIRRQGICLLFALAVVVATPQTQAEGGALTLRQTLDQALTRYPSIKVSAQQRAAAASGIKLARQVYLPRVEGVVNINRQTSNNAGSIWFFPAAAPFSENIGSRPRSSGATGWTSAVGSYIGWEPFDFGSRRARVEAAISGEQRAAYNVERTKLEVAAGAADAYLTVLAAEGTTVAAQAAVERAEVFVRVVGAQVRATIRPGADDSRARAELAAAKIQLSQAEQAVGVARAVLAQYVNGKATTVEPLSLPKLPVAPPIVVTDLTDHPSLQVQKAAVAEAQARLKVAERSADPRFTLEGSVFGYDSAFETGGARDSSEGLGFAEDYNYGVGVTMNVPFGELLVISDRKSQERARLSAETELQELLRLELTRQLGELDANLIGTRRVAEETPLLVKAAREAYAQAVARYQAGLSEVVDVADTQRVLAQAEIDDALASLAVWQTWFSAASLAPSVEAFLKGVPY